MTPPIFSKYHTHIIYMEKRNNQFQIKHLQKGRLKMFINDHLIVVLIVIGLFILISGYCKISLKINNKRKRARKDGHKND